MRSHGDDLEGRDGAEMVRCIARLRDDPLDQELATRLNRGAEIGKDADHLKTLRPSIVEACGWMAAALAVVAATLQWLT